ncbi:MAG: hypothetical protein U1E11_07340, partial [Dethiobacteria bacterium]|nr:hypothetical protein [Dethiobacteria bacterium]
MKGLLYKSTILVYLVMMILAFTWHFSATAHANPAQPTIPYNCTFGISGYPEIFNVVNGKVDYYEQSGDKVYSFSGDLSYGYDSIEGLMKIDRGSGWKTEEIYKINFFSEEWRANTGFIHMEKSGFYDFTWELVSVGDPVTKPEA